MNRKILITRPLEQAQDFARDLKALGYQTLINPLLTIQSPDFVLPRPASDYKALILTSTHAVSQAVRAGVRLDIPLYLVGNTTKAAAQTAGFVNILHTAPKATLLWKHISQDSPILYLRGKDIAFPMAEKFDFCDDVIVYEAIAAESFSQDCINAFQAGDIQAVTVFSARTARIFCDLYNHSGLPKNIKVLCFGNSVLECVRPNMFEAYGSAEPSRESMISLIRAHCPL